MGDDKDVSWSEVERVFRRKVVYPQAADDPPCYPGVAAFKRWVGRELPTYLAQAGHSATRDGFGHHIDKLLPTNPEVGWPFGADGYLDCSDFEVLIDAVWDTLR